MTAGSLGALAACSAQPEEPESPRTLTYLDSATWTTLYPPSVGFYPNGGIMNNIADRLLYQDPVTRELHPWLATSLPEVSADGTQFTFKLRQGVTHSDGTPLNAQNVANNFDLYGKGDKDRKLTVSEQITGYASSEVLDDYTVRFTFEKPALGFPQATSSMNAGILSDASLALDTTGFGPGSATKVVGSGPFVISQENLGTELVLTAREDYNWAPPVLKHQGRALLDQITIALASEDSVRVGALIANQAQIARQIEAPVEDHIIDRGLQVVAAATNGVNNTWDLRFQHPILSDIRVRQAIRSGIDREHIVKTLFSPRYKLATGPLASGALGYVNHEGAFTYDPDQAVALLEEAGWVMGEDGIRTKDGQRLSLTVNWGAVQPRNREQSTVIQEQLRRIGIEINIFPGDRSAQSAATLDHTIIQINSSMVGRADYDVIKSQYCSENRDSLLNLNPQTEEIGDQELEDLTYQVAQAATEAERAEASAKIQQLLIDKAYTIPIFEEPQVFGLQPNISGFTTDPIGRPSFYAVTFNA
ncbi:TIGR04028 family ABC transporter substrate-binding protein [Rothia nasimurium]|uniref:TIGR04028 family ABC transporter substrate-binding protein n=1 Tax=Rothia nasimurium TaxID=85336 RepID=UPI003BA077C9